MAKNKTFTYDSSYYNGNIRVDFMENILKLAENLAQEIKESGLYQQFEDAKANLQKHTELQGQLNQFKRMQFEAETSGKELPLDEEKYIAKLYFDLMRNPISKTYLETEQGLLNMVCEINRLLYSEFPIEINFI